jgi:hypothetical protein
VFRGEPIGASNARHIAALPGLQHVCKFRQATAFSLQAGYSRYSFIYRPRKINASAQMLKGKSGTCRSQVPRAVEGSADAGTLVSQHGKADMANVLAEKQC